MISPDAYWFTLDKGKVKSQCRLKSNEIVGSPEFFSELCIRAEIKTGTADRKIKP